MTCCGTYTKAGTEQFGHPLMQVIVDGAALILAGGFGFLDALGLALAPLLVILAHNGGHHIHQH